MKTLHLGPADALFEAFDLEKINLIISNLVKIALINDNIYFNSPVERENLLYFEGLIQEFLKKNN